MTRTTTQAPKKPEKPKPFRVSAVTLPQDAAVVIASFDTIEQAQAHVKKIYEQGYVVDDRSKDPSLNEEIYYPIAYIRTISIHKTKLD